MTPAEFVAARLDELAVLAGDMAHQNKLGRPFFDVNRLAGGTLIRQLIDAESVLRMVEAQRKIPALHQPSTDHGHEFDPYCVGCWEEGGYEGAPSYPCKTVRALTQQWSDHPDWQEAWA